MKYLDLSDIGKIETGTTPRSSDAANYASNDIPFIKPSDIDDDKITLIERGEFYISNRAKKEARIVPKGSVLVTCIGNIGKIGILQNECAFNQQINAIIPNFSLISPKFLAYAIKAQQKTLNAKANAAVVPIINKSSFSKIKICVPELLEQDKVLKRLGLVDQLITLHERQINKLNILIKSEFVEIFGDPVRNEKSWSTKTLKDLSVKITNGTTPKGGSKVYAKKGIMFLRSQNIWKNKIDLDDVAYIDDKTNEKMLESVLKHNDILITKTGRINTENSSLGRSALYKGKDGQANINGHVYLVRLKPEINHLFVLNILISDSYRELIRKMCVGGIDKRQLNKNHVEDFPIILPPIKLQNHFAAFVQQVDKSRLAVQKSLGQLEILKKSLMQKYFG